MRGRKGEYVVLGLSFFGWSLLSMVIGGIAGSIAGAVGGAMGIVVVSGDLLNTVYASGGWFITLISSLAVLPFNMWLTSYMNVTYAHYYLAITEPERKAEAQPPLDNGYRGPAPF